MKARTTLLGSHGRELPFFGYNDVRVGLEDNSMVTNDTPTS
ncbi:hypothetical protein [Rubrobacter tropicus]|nr:hypothetical protein [Rubrobacter tropicus]